MRAYFFTNMYLSSIQQGIQPLHVIADMFVRYMPSFDSSFGESNPTQIDILYEWARYHKTVICLNGGYSENLHNIITEFMISDDNPYPWAAFYEGVDALEGALTSVGIVLPEKIYEGASLIRDAELARFLNSTKSLIINDLPVEFTDWEIEFMQEMNKYGLAK